MEWKFQCKRQSRLLQKMFEDSNGVISSFKSKDIQCKWPQKKRQAMIGKTLHRESLRWNKTNSVGERR